MHKLNKKKNAHYNNTSYNNDNTIVTISRYVENSCMFAPGIFSYGQAYWGILRHT